jgi:hypothetical protein
MIRLRPAWDLQKHSNNNNGGQQQQKTNTSGHRLAGHLARPAERLLRARARRAHDCRLGVGLARGSAQRGGQRGVRRAGAGVRDPHLADAGRQCLDLCSNGDRHAANWDEEKKKKKSKKKIKKKSELFFCVEIVDSISVLPLLLLLLLIASFGPCLANNFTICFCHRDKNKPEKKKKKKLGTIGYVVAV